MPSLVKRLSLLFLDETPGSDDAAVQGIASEPFGRGATHGHLIASLLQRTEYSNQSATVDHAVEEVLLPALEASTSPDQNGEFLLGFFCGLSGVNHPEAFRMAAAIVGRIPAETLATKLPQGVVSFLRKLERITLLVENLRASSLQSPSEREEAVSAVAQTSGARKLLPAFQSTEGWSTGQAWTASAVIARGVLDNLCNDVVANAELVAAAFLLLTAKERRTPARPEYLATELLDQGSPEQLARLPSILLGTLRGWQREELPARLVSSRQNSSDPRTARGVRVPSKELLGAKASQIAEELPYDKRLLIAQPDRALSPAQLAARAEGRKVGAEVGSGSLRQALLEYSSSHTPEEVEAFVHGILDDGRFRALVEQVVNHTPAKVMREQFPPRLLTFLRESISSLTLENKLDYTLGKVPSPLSAQLGPYLLRALPEGRAKIQRTQPPYDLGRADGEELFGRLPKALRWSLATGGPEQEAAQRQLVELLLPELVSYVSEYNDADCTGFMYGLWELLQELPPYRLERPVFEALILRYPRLLRKLEEMLIVDMLESMELDRAKGAYAYRVTRLLFERLDQGVPIEELGLLAEQDFENALATLCKANGWAVESRWTRQEELAGQASTLVLNVTAQGRLDAEGNFKPLEPGETLDAPLEEKVRAFLAQGFEQKVEVRFIGSGEQAPTDPEQSFGPALVESGWRGFGWEQVEQP